MSLRKIIRLIKKSLLKFKRLHIPKQIRVYPLDSPFSKEEGLAVAADCVQRCRASVFMINLCMAGLFFTSYEYWQGNAYSKDFQYRLGDIGQATVDLYEANDDLLEMYEPMLVYLNNLPATHSARNWVLPSRQELNACNLHSAKPYVDFVDHQVRCGDILGSYKFQWISERYLEYTILLERDGGVVEDVNWEMRKQNRSALLKNTDKQAYRKHRIDTRLKNVINAYLKLEHKMAGLYEVVSEQDTRMPLTHISHRLDKKELNTSFIHLNYYVARNSLLVIMIFACLYLNSLTFQMMKLSGCGLRYSPTFIALQSTRIAKIMVLSWYAGVSASVFLAILVTVDFDGSLFSIGLVYTSILAVITLLVSTIRNFKEIRRVNLQLH